MDEKLKLNAINALYFLYFENREIVYYFERIWTDDGMRYHDEEYSYIFCGMSNPNFYVELEVYFSFLDNNMIEQTSGNEHEIISELNDYSMAHLSTILKEKKSRNEKQID